MPRGRKRRSGNNRGAIRTTVDGITFASQLEAKRYGQLKMMQEAGVIRDLELQPRFELIPPFVQFGKKYRGVTYVADFRYYDITKERIIVEDTKGYREPVFIIKEKMFRYKNPDLDFRLVTRHEI